MSSFRLAIVSLSLFNYWNWDNGDRGAVDKVIFEKSVINILHEIALRDTSDDSLDIFDI